MEKFSTVLKSKWTLFVASGIVTLATMSMAGCSNPANRESDPLKSYKGLQGDKPIGEQKKVDQFCDTPYTLVVRTLNDQGAEIDADTNLQFLIGQQKTYRIYLTSSIKIAISLSGAPQGMDLTKINDSRWDLTWQPETSDGGSSQPVKLIATAPDKQSCLATDLGDLQIVTNKGSLQPTLSVTGFDANKTYSATDRIAFVVSVSDPTLTSSTKIPDSPTFEFPSKEGTTTFITAKNVIQCGGGQSIPEQWLFRYSCAFNIDQLAAQNRDKDGIRMSEMKVGITTKGGTAVQFTVKIPINLPKATEKGTTP